MCYNLLQNWQKPFTVQLYRKINLSCLLRSQLGKSVAKLLWHISILPVLKSFIQRRLERKLLSIEDRSQTDVNLQAERAAVESRTRADIPSVLFKSISLRFARSLHIDICPFQAQAAVTIVWRFVRASYLSTRKTICIHPSGGGVVVYFFSF